MNENGLLNALVPNDSLTHKDFVLRRSSRVGTKRLGLGSLGGYATPHEKPVQRRKRNPFENDRK